MRWNIGNPLIQELARVAGILRLRATKKRIRGEARRSGPRLSAGQIGSTRSFELLPLYEAEAEEGLLSGFGVSYLIRTDSAAILFDLGNNPKGVSPSPLTMNMEGLRVKMTEMDMLFISHRHPDHVGGRKWWDARSFSPDGMFQPDLGDTPVYVSDRLRYPHSRQVTIKKVGKLAEGVWTTGPFAFFEPYPSLSLAPNYSEQALAINVAGFGLVLVTGCGHMGLRRLVEGARAAFDVPIVGIIGGLHLTDADADRLEPEIRFLRDLDPSIVAVSSHDSGPVAVDAFAQAFPTSLRPIKVGKAIKLP